MFVADATVADECPRSVPRIPFALSTRPAAPPTPPLVGDGGVGGRAGDGVDSFVEGIPLEIPSCRLGVSNLLTPLPLPRPAPVPALLLRELLARLDSGLRLPTGLMSTPLPLPPLMLPTLTLMLPALFFALSLREVAEDVRTSVRPRRSSTP